jgi:hypothetical protein
MIGEQKAKSYTSMEWFANVEVTKQQAMKLFENVKWHLNLVNSLYVCILFYLKFCQNKIHFYFFYYSVISIGTIYFDTKWMVYFTSKILRVPIPDFLWIRNSYSSVNRFFYRTYYWNLQKTWISWMVETWWSRITCTWI